MKKKKKKRPIYRHVLMKFQKQNRKDGLMYQSSRLKLGRLWFVVDAIGNGGLIMSLRLVVQLCWGWVEVRAGMVRAKFSRLAAESW